MENSNDKYKINIDRERLIAIRNEIVINCSIIKKECKTECARVNCFIKNWKKTDKYIELNVKQIDSYVPSWDDGYQVIDVYNFDAYYFPEIVNVIDDILKGNLNRINDLKDKVDLPSNIDSLRDIKSLERLKELIDMYIKNNSKNTYQEIVDLINNYTHYNIEMPKQTIEEYLPKLRECFEFIKVDSTDIEKVRQIFGDNYLEKLNEILKIEQETYDSIMASSIEELGKSENPKINIKIKK